MNRSIQFFLGITTLLFASFSNAQISGAQDAFLDGASQLVWRSRSAMMSSMGPRAAIELSASELQRNIGILRTIEKLESATPGIEVKRIGVLFLGLDSNYTAIVQAAGEVLTNISQSTKDVITQNLIIDAVRERINLYRPHPSAATMNRAVGLIDAATEQTRIKQSKTLADSINGWRGGGSKAAIESLAKWSSQGYQAFHVNYLQALQSLPWTEIYEMRGRAAFNFNESELKKAMDFIEGLTQLTIVTEEQHALRMGVLEKALLSSTAEISKAAAQSLSQIAKSNSSSTGQKVFITRLNELLHFVQKPRVAQKGRVSNALPYADRASLIVDLISELTPVNREVYTMKLNAISSSTSKTYSQSAGLRALEIEMTRGYTSPASIICQGLL